MKKILSLACAITLVFTLSTNTLTAQSGDYKSNIYAGAGFSLAGAVTNVIGAAFADSTNVNTSSFPAIQFTYDYAVTPKISLGAGFSYQGFGFDVDNYTFLNDSFNIVTEDFSANVRRTNIALRALFHYGNNEKLDMYSGVRLGVTNWSGTTETTDPDFDLLGDFSGWNFSPQLIAFGLRYFVTDNIGLSFESTIGAPHFLSAGINYRL